jgi:sirohydrochlorin cobaltochelatase
MPRTAPDRRSAGPDADRPVTLLLALRDPGSSESLRRLARRLAARLGHPVEPCLLDAPGDPLAGAVERAVDRGAGRLVALPLVLGLSGEAASHLGTLLARVSRRWPRLRVHRGDPPDADDVARILGDRARAAAAAGGRRSPTSGEVVVVVAGGGGANPVGNAELARLARLVYEAHRFADVGYAFVDLTAPTVRDAIGRWARLGARRIVVVPHLLFAGRTHRRLSAQVRAAAKEAGVPATLAPPLDSHPALLPAIVRRYVEAQLDARVVEELRQAHAHDGVALADIEARMAALLPPRYQDPAVAVSSAPMGAAAVQRDSEGRVAWDVMWQGFCELALAGGPPHRGTLLEPPPREEILAEPERYRAVLEELARGIRMITGLNIVLGPPGWIGVRCGSEAMAIWLLRAIVVENVMARREDATLYLPAGPRFAPDGEIRNVVTALAKTHHYWTQHSASPAAPASTAPGAAGRPLDRAGDERSGGRGDRVGGPRANQGPRRGPRLDAAPGSVLHITTDATGDGSAGSRPERRAGPGRRGHRPRPDEVGDRP